jgi:hypothetical protein
MTDVRLTALNPEDSTVVPVACNSSGELLVDKGEPEGPDLNVEGDLSVGGSITAAGGDYRVSDKGNVISYVNNENAVSSNDTWVIFNKEDNGYRARINGDGSAKFAGNISVDSYINCNRQATGDEFGLQAKINDQSKFIAKASGTYIGTNLTNANGVIGGSAINLLTDGSARFAGVGKFGSTVYAKGTGTDNVFLGLQESSTGNFDPTNATVTIKVDGSADFDGRIKIGPGPLAPAVAGSVYYPDSVDVRRDDGGPVYTIFKSGNTVRDITLQFKSDGSGKFSGDVTVGSRSKSWMLVEQGGLCHMVEQTRSLIDEGFSVDADADADYPKLRDVFNELDLIERSLSQVMEKLRLTPPAGWPVWDGSDETQ